MSATPVVFAEHVARGARIRRLLRILLVVFFVAVLLTEPPSSHLVACWVVVGAYLGWTLAIGVLSPHDGRALRYLWVALVVDVGTLTVLSLLSDASAAVTWTPYLLSNGFFVIPIIAAAQLNPLMCAAVVAPSVAVYLVSGLVVAGAGDEPLSYVVLRTLVLASVGLGAVLLSRLQRSRVETIAGLLDDRTALLAELVAIEQRERRELAESLHDGALQYVLAARQELDDLVDGDARAGERVEEALRESTRLLRGTLTRLHPAVVDTAGLLAALRDLVESTQSRGRLEAELSSDGWAEDLRTAADELLLSTARELLTNVVKHAGAHRVRVELGRGSGSARLRVADDGNGMRGVDLQDRLAGGHLGLASRRVRIEAARGTLRISPGDPRGTVVDVEVPLP